MYTTPPIHINMMSCRGNTATCDSAAASAASPMLGATARYPLMALLPPVGGVIDVVVGIFSKIGINEIFFLLFDLAKAVLATVERWHAFLFCIYLNSLYGSPYVLAP